MVDIDKVYQRVLALANKEQRGYITPQEFNLYANQAQMELYEQYFYDLNNFEIRDAAFSLNDNITDITRKKLDIFLTTASTSMVASFGSIGFQIKLPNYVYRVSRVELNGLEVEYVDMSGYKDRINTGRLIGPSASRPIYTQLSNLLRVSDGNDVISGVSLDYYRVPKVVSWGYFVLSQKALYDSSTAKTTHFEMHPAEESELVYKILKFAGISMAKQDILQAGQGMESMQVQQQKQ